MQHTLLDHGMMFFFENLPSLLEMISLKQSESETNMRKRSLDYHKQGAWAIANDSWVKVTDSIRGKAQNYLQLHRIDILRPFLIEGKRTLQDINLAPSIKSGQIILG
jgi:hypothetical protein